MLSSSKLFAGIDLSDAAVHALQCSKGSYVMLHVQYLVHIQYLLSFNKNGLKT